MFSKSDCLIVMKPPLQESMKLDSIISDFLLLIYEHIERSCCPAPLLVNTLENYINMMMTRVVKIVEK
uniref:Uncharacterized protein n=1 Tax=Lepeophtheirus salmonis TaxID=72036 RepID=A0A0K2UNM2_LEPSM